MNRNRRDDWRTRMKLRGGAVSHTVARMGWLVFAAVGAVAMVGVAALYAANPGERGADNSTAANFVGGLIVMLPIGALIGALLGLPVQFAVRSWLRNPSGAEREAARAAEEARAKKNIPVHGLHTSGRWARSYRTCARSVAAYHSVVAALPNGAGRDWFAGIGETLDDELSEALRLARLGESLAPPGAGELGETASQVLDLLRVAEKSFAETTNRAAAIALELREDSDFVRVRAQLDMLAEQAPHLRGSDVGE